MADSHTYTDEYRRECADLVIASGRPATQMADEIGVNRKTLQHWVQRRKMELEGAMPTDDPELKAAQKRIRETRDGKRLPEKSRGLLRQRPGVRARYRLMEAEKANFPVKTMARLLGVSRSGFYEWLRRGEPKDPWLQARADVEREWAESDRRFGARLVRSRLPHLTLYRVRKIMRGLGIRGVTPNARKRTTIPDAGRPREARPAETRLHGSRCPPTSSSATSPTSRPARDGCSSRR